MACVQAAEKLQSSSKIAGKAFFITNDEPYPFWTFLGDILEPLGYDRPHIHLPFLLVFVLAVILERVITPLLKPIVRLPPSEFNPARVRISASNRHFNIARAKRELGYKPNISLKEGIARTVAHFQPLAKGHEYHKTK